MNDDINSPMDSDSPLTETETPNAPPTLTDAEPLEYTSAEDAAPTETDNILPQLTAITSCIIGCLMEKSRTASDAYPLSLNSLLLACNQKNSREPMITLTGGEALQTVEALAERDFVGVDRKGRSYRYEHWMRTVLGVSKVEQALLAVLMLRELSTLNHLKKAHRTDGRL